MTALRKTFFKRRRPFSKFKGDKKGVAAIEFALIAPILIILLFASIDAIFALSAKRKVSIAANSLADLTARLSLGNVENEAEGLLELGELLVAPFDTSGAQFRITQLQVQPNGVTAIVESDNAQASFASQGKSPLSKGTVKPLPSPLNPGDYVILSEASLVYRTKFGIFDWALGGDGDIKFFNLTEQAYFRTRSGGPVL